MLVVSQIQLYPNSREEHLPGYTPQFPHIASLVHADRYAGGTAAWHWHKALELFYIESGSLIYRTPGCEACLAAGSGGLVNSNILHSTRVATPNRPTVIKLHLFDPALIAGVPGGLAEQRYIAPFLTAGPELLPLHAKDPRAAEALTLLRQSLALDENAYGYELRLQALLSEIWLRLTAPLQLSPSVPPRQSPGQEKAKQMMLFIDTHYAEKLSAADIARAAFCSERACYRIFDTCLHTTPAAYLKTVRLRAACALLLETDRTVTDIAQSCGFGTSSYFGSQLMQEMGLTPTAYRAKWQNLDS